MFFKKCRLKVGGKYKWFPRAVTLSRNPVDTQELANHIAAMSTASPGDVHLVLRCLPDVMAMMMDSGRPVHIDGLGSFFFKLSCAGRGVDSPDEVSRKQIKAVRVQFLPERQGNSRQRHVPMTRRVSLVSWEGLIDDENGTASAETTE